MEKTDKKSKKKRRYRHLNQSDRDRIEALLDAGHEQKEIAAILQVDKGTISREITKRKRKNGHYVASSAQQKAGVKRSNSKYQGMKIEKYPEIRKRIVAELQIPRSPDEIAGRMELEKLENRVTKSAIYKWLYSSWGQAYCRYLCTRRYKKRKQKKTPKREMIPNRVSLTKRPKEGIHAQGDQFVSPTSSGEQKSGAIVCIPVAQLLVGTLVANKKPATMVEAIQYIVSGILIDDLTMDNGMENRYHNQFGLPVYFADPHAPWQKPDVENGIGLLRRWFIKKGTNLATVSEEQFQMCLHILNGKYRKSLGYKSAYEVALEHGIIQKVPTMLAGKFDRILLKNIFQESCTSL
jgi:IS30 family transposase